MAKAAGIERIERRAVTAREQAEAPFGGGDPLFPAETNPALLQHLNLPDIGWRKPEDQEHGEKAT
jgi:hypothetical protein